MTTHIVNLASDPRARWGKDGCYLNKPSSCVRSRFEEGEIDLMPDRLDAITSKSQKVLEDPGAIWQGASIPNGKKVYAELQEAGHFLLNAAVLEYFLENQELVPKEWKHANGTFFFGTIFLDQHGEGCVRGLEYFGGKIQGTHKRLKDLFNRHVKIAVYNHD